MILFVHQFITYLLIVLVSMGVVVLAIFLGKRWRDAKDRKDAGKLDTQIADHMSMQENEQQAEEI